MTAFNAAGTYSSSMVIFKWRGVSNEWLYGSPDNALVKVSDNGRMNTELLVEGKKPLCQSCRKLATHSIFSSSMVIHVMS